MSTFEVFETGKDITLFLPDQLAAYAGRIAREDAKYFIAYMRDSDVDTLREISERRNQWAEMARAHFDGPETQSRFHHAVGSLTSRIIFPEK